MAKAQGSVTWHPGELLIQVEGLSLDLIDKLALEVIAVSNPPVDTGFLDASAYVNSSSGLNTFEEIWQPGQYISRHTGLLVDRDSVDNPQPPPKNGAVAGWAAIYAEYVNENTDYIYNALQEVAQRHR